MPYKPLARRYATAVAMSERLGSLAREQIAWENRKRVQFPSIEPGPGDPNWKGWDPDGVAHLRKMMK
jgi:hypothetical protein